MTPRRRLGDHSAHCGCKGHSLGICVAIVLRTSASFCVVHCQICGPSPHVHIAVFTLDAGPLARCQCSEGPATDHLETGFLSWFPCVFKANAEVVPKYPRCYYMFLM